MEIRKVKHAAMVDEWRERIIDCRNSGKPVTIWCAENAISVKTYYRWERLWMTKIVTQQQDAAPTAADLPLYDNTLVKVDPKQLNSGASDAVGQVVVNTFLFSAYG